MTEVLTAPEGPSPRPDLRRRLVRVWLITHLAFWLAYLAFRAAAAWTNPEYASNQAMLTMLMANRTAVSAAMALLTGALLALVIWRRRRAKEPFSLGSAALLLGGALALLPVTQLAEEVSANWFIDGRFSLMPSEAAPPLIAYAFMFGWIMPLWAAVQALIGYHYLAVDQRDRLAHSQSLFQKTQLEMLRYQLNPHFLFNTLNAISTLVLERRNADAERMLLRLCDFLRYTLEGDQRAMEPIAREIEAQRAYLDIEQARFGPRLKVTFSVEQGAEAALAPAMILQPLLENAIKHAVAPSPDGAHIDVTVRRSGDDLVLIIDDDGPGAAPREPEDRPGLGLNNARRRIELQYGERARLTAGPKAPRGYRAEIVMPFAKAGAA